MVQFLPLLCQCLNSRTFQIPDQSAMAMCKRSASLLVLLIVVCLLPQSNALRFQVEIRECVGYNVSSWGDIVHGSYVVVDSSSEDDWSMDWDVLNAVDITVSSPHDRMILPARKVSSYPGGVFGIQVLQRSHIQKIQGVVYRVEQPHSCSLGCYAMVFFF